MKPSLGCINRLALVAVALLSATHLAFSVAELGDYPSDAGPAIMALLHGNLHAFAQARPMMGDVSLLARAPFAAIAYLGGSPTELSIYRWGALACVLSVAALALWLGAIARRRGTGPLGEWAILLVSLLNPLVSSALAAGHPEELLTASLCIGALVAALQRRWLLSTVLLGLAIATKQWMIVAVLPVVFALERDRLRALLGALALAVLVTVPEAIASPAAFGRNQLSVTHGSGRFVSLWSWWWPIAPHVTRHIAVEGHPLSVTFRSLPVALERMLRPLSVVVATAVALVAARTRRLPLGRDDAFALMSLVLLLRCTLNSETADYFHVSLLFSLVAWDALSGERFPVRALAGTAVAYLLFGDFAVAHLSFTLLSGLYGACTLAVAMLLARSLARRPRTVSRPARLAASGSA